MLVLTLKALAGFALVGSAFWPMERLFPARRGQPILRPGLLTDIAYFLGINIPYGALSLVVLSSCRSACGAVVPASFRAAVAAQPYALQALEAMLLSDLAVYWFHRASHSWELLWRFHAIHHSVEHLDWVAANREHPVDGLLTQLAMNLPPFLLGFPLETLSFLLGFRGMWAIFIHSNIRLPLGPLGLLLGSPELHHWHHLRTERTVHNFANLSPLMDVLFGTHFHPRGEEAWPLGLPEPFPRGWAGQMLSPFRRRSPR